MWELAGNYTGCMIGYHAAPVISDAYMKGIDGYDTALALEAMTANATEDRLGISTYAKEGLLTTATQAESVSKTLEYAYDDWTIARMAEKMGQEKVSQEYYRRAQFYKNVFDPGTGFMRARTNNRWFYPFTPEEVNFNYTEANAWQYSYYVPQDIQGWVDLMGGEAAAERKLDDLFTATTQTSGRHQADITGLIGQYAHGNEPSHHIAYLYNYLGKPYKTQKYVRRIMDELYHNAPDGLSGNEDCGQMSAWLVMSALGFYPVAPGSNDYVIGSPWFDLVQVQLENGNAITIEAEDNSDENVYVQEIYDGESFYDKSYLTHELLMEGPYLYFNMGPEPEKEMGANPESRPRSSISTMPITALPVLTTGDRSFVDETEITLQSVTPEADIYYQINEGEVHQYTEPFTINNDLQLTTWAEKKGHHSSPTAVSQFTKMDKNKAITIESSYAPQYAAGGDKALIDKLRGGTDFRNGVWQGYEGQDMSVIIDLGKKKKKISEVRVGFLQDENAWIFMPTNLEVYVGSPGKWKHFGTLHNDRISPLDRGAIIKDFVVRGTAKTSKVKVVAKSLKYCPDYHKGAGGKCWVFSDEVVVK